MSWHTTFMRIGHECAKQGIGGVTLELDDMAFERLKFECHLVAGKDGPTFTGDRVIWRYYDVTIIAEKERKVKPGKLTPEELEELRKMEEKGEI